MARGRTRARARGRAHGTGDDWSRGRPERFRGHGLGPYYDPERGVTVVSGAVSNYADQAGTGLDVAQATSGLRPTMTTLNGRTLFAFDGSSQYLFRTSSTNNGVGAVIAVIRRDATQSVQDRYMFTFGGFVLMLRTTGDAGWNSYVSAYIPSGVTLATGSAYVLGVVQRAFNDIDQWTNGAKHNGTNGTAFSNYTGVCFGGYQPIPTTYNAAVSAGPLARFSSVPPNSVLVRVMKAYACKYRIAIAKA